MRYERSGKVRESWSQPVAWAGLDKEAPTEAWALDDLQQVRGILEGRYERVTEQVDNVREGLRAARAAERAQGISPRHPSPRTIELAGTLTQLRFEQATLGQQIEGVELGLDDEPWPVEPAHGHLRHRAVPLTQEDNVRSRLLRVWSAASASVMLSALGVLLLFNHSGLLWPIVWIAMAMLVIEAILRRRLASLLMAVLVAGLTFLGLWAVWSLFTGNLRVGFGILLLLASMYMAVQTAREGIRTR
jgi:hypothetical protein